MALACFLSFFAGVLTTIAFWWIGQLCEHEGCVRPVVTLTRCDEHTREARP